MRSPWAGGRSPPRSPPTGGGGRAGPGRGGQVADKADLDQLCAAGGQRWRLDKMANRIAYVRQVRPWKRCRLVALVVIFALFLPALPPLPRRLRPTGPASVGKDGAIQPR